MTAEWRDKCHCTYIGCIWDSILEKKMLKEYGEVFDHVSPLHTLCLDIFLQPRQQARFPDTPPSGGKGANTGLGGQISSNFCLMKLGQLGHMFLIKYDLFPTKCSTI